MRIEIERKKAASSNDTRTAELGCYMTLCAMEPAHKFLVYKSAMTYNYKANNFITATKFAQLILELESTGIFATTPEIIPKYKKYF